MSLQFLHYASIDSSDQHQLAPPTHPSRDNSTTSNISTDSNPTSRRTSFGNFSVAALARQMTSKSSRSNSQTSNSASQHSSNPATTDTPQPTPGKDYKSIKDFEQEHSISMSESSSYQNEDHNGHSHENDSLIHRVKEAIPMMGSPNPNGQLHIIVITVKQQQLAL